MRHSSLFALALLVAGCGGSVASIDGTPPSGSGSANATSGGTSVGAGGDKESSGSGGVSSGGATSGGTSGSSGTTSCTLPPPSTPTTSVTFHLTNTSQATRWVAIGGHGCSIFGIAQGGKDVPQEAGNQCICECPNPGPPRVDRYKKVLPGESIDVPWMAHELVQCKQQHDCSADGWKGMGMVDEWKSSVQNLPAGSTTAKLRAASTLPTGCSEGPNGEAMCEGSGPWTPATFSPVAPFCEGGAVVAVDFTLPKSGKIVVDVALP